MPLHDAIYSHLSGYAGLTALVSTRIYPIYRAQDSALPAVTFHRIASTPLNDFQQSCGERVRVQVSVWAEKVSDANSVTAQVRAAMATFSGTFGDTKVQSADPGNSVEFWETAENGRTGDKGTVHQVTEFEVFVT